MNVRRMPMSNLNDIFFTPVSYTHLSTEDYKVSDISLEFNVENGRVEYIFYCDVAVSYTHLWNYLKLLFEAAERYVLLGVLVYTAPVAFSMGASQTTANIWKSWCRMLGGQIFLVSFPAVNSSFSSPCTKRGRQSQRKSTLFWSKMSWATSTNRSCAP